MVNFNSTVCPVCGTRSEDGLGSFSCVCDACYDNLRQDFIQAFETVISTYSFNSDELEVIKFMIFESKDLIPDMEEAIEKAIKEQQELEEARRVLENAV